MTDIKKEPAPRVPRNAEAITAGALTLHLKDRVALKDALIASIADEVKAITEAAATAKEIAGIK